MDIAGKRIPPALYGLCFILCTGIFLLFIMIMTTRGLNGEVRGNYIPVLYAEDIPETIMREALEEYFVPDAILSPATLKIEISHFSHIEEIPLADIGERLDPEDPRLGIHYRQLKNLFGLNPHKQLILIDTRTPFLSFLVKVVRLERERGWDLILPDVDFAEIGLKLGLGLFILCSNFVFATGRRFPLLKILAFLPWLVYLPGASPLLLPAMFCLFYCWFSFYDSCAEFLENALFRGWWRRRELWLSLMLLCLSLLFTLGLCLRVDGLIFPYQPFLAMVFLSGAFMLLRLYLGEKRAHHLFRYVRFDSGSPLRALQIKKSNLLLIFIIMLVITSIPLYYLARSDYEMYKVPVPLRLSGVGLINDENILTMLSMDTRNQYPDTVAYVQHLYAQYSNNFNTKGPVLTTTTYSQTKSGVITAQEKALPLHIPRIRQQLTAVSGQNPGRLLTVGGEAAAFQARFPGEIYKQKYLAWYEMKFYLLWLVPLFLFYYYGTPSFLFAIRNFIMRRMRGTA